MTDESPLLIIEPDPDIAAEYRERRDRDAAEAQRRYHELLTTELAAEFPEIENVSRVATFAMQTLFRHHRFGTDDECSCGCHPRLPSSDLHDYGFDCSCTWDEAKREEQHQEWLARMQEWWDSPECKAMAERRKAEDAELENWLANHPEIKVSRRLGA
jgi:hypothetical protein